MKLNAIGKEIRYYHTECLAAGKAFILSAIECGKRLMIARRDVKSGDWGTWLDSIGLKSSTANYYMRAYEFATRNPQKVQWLAAQGAPFVQLLREAGIIKPCQGGGYRSEAYQRRKLLGDEQLAFPFAFEEFEQHIRALIKAPNVEELAVSSLDALEADLTASLARVREIKAKKTAIDIPPTE